MMITDDSKLYLCWMCQLPVNESTTDALCTIPDIKDICFVDSTTAAIHVAFLLIFSGVMLTLVYNAKFTNRYCYSKYLRRLPGHTCRYVLTAASLLILITCSAEGVLTDRLESNEQATTRPHLYLQFLISTITLVLSMVYYHHVESLRLPQRFQVVLILYWTISVAGEILRLLNLLALEKASVYILRFDLNCALLAMYGAMFAVEWVCLIVQKSHGETTSGHHQSQNNESSTNENANGELPAMMYLHDHVNLASSWTFGWFRWLLRMGYKKRIEISDLGELPSQHQSLQIYKGLSNFFHRELEQSHNKGYAPSMWRVVFKAYRWTILGSGVLKLLADLAGFIGPVVICFIVQYVTDSIDGKGLQSANEKVSPQLVSIEVFFANGFVLVGTMIIACVVQFVCEQYHIYMCIVMSIHAKTAVQTMIYEKALGLSTFTLSGGSMTVGHVTNHMSTDAMNLLFFFQKMHLIWAIPVKIVIALGLLYYQIGTASLLGSVVFVSIMPLIFVLATIMSNLLKQVMKLTDDRLKHSNELLQGMKLLKLYGWENLFCRAVEQIRKIEIRKIFKYNACFGINVSVCQTAPVLVTLVAFSSYPYLSKQPLTPGVTFTSLALMNMLIEPLYLLPLAISLLVNATVSAERISAFFLAPEVGDRGGSHILLEGQPEREILGATVLEECVTEEEEEETRPLLPGASSVQTYDGIPLLPVTPSVQILYNTNKSVNSSSLPSNVAIKIKGGFFSWDMVGSPVISGLDVEIPAGKLTVVVGPVGSGKSSLLSAVFLEMKTLRGIVEINQLYSSIAYAAQKAWIVNASLRDNILFGQPFDAERYQHVVNACSLQPDIDILPGGDMIEIGEKGINLSGGQKQRVSVARAMYSLNNIVLMDDPFSAVDVHVGSHLFQEGITGLLLGNEKRTVVLVTHQLQYLQHADLILIMKEGRIAQQGTFDEICNADTNLSNLWSLELCQRDNELAESDKEAPGSDSEVTIETERRMLRQQVTREKARFELAKTSSDEGTSEAGKSFYGINNTLE